MADLTLDWASAEAARYACERWHYSKRVPVFKAIRVGVWEDDAFIGVVMFGQGATPELGSPYGLTTTQCCELTRIALAKHQTPVSRIVAIAIRFLRRRSPGLRLIVSFADQAQGHVGGIYQAGGWLYVGGAETHAYIIHGEAVHSKTLHSRYGIGGQSIPWLRKHVDQNARRVISGFKHRYLYPLDHDMRQQLLPLSKPYPKRAKQAMTGDHPEQRRRDTDPHAPLTTTRPTWTPDTYRGRDDDDVDAAAYRPAGRRLPDLGCRQGRGRHHDRTIAPGSAGLSALAPGAA